MKKNDKLPLIAVTKPKSGFRPGPGSTNSKYHPILSPDRLRDIFNYQSQISLHIAESPTHLVKEATSIPTPPAAPSHTEQHSMSPAEQVAQEGEVASSSEGGMAAGELCSDPVASGSNSPGYQATVAHDSELLSPSPLSDNCCDNFRSSQHDPYGADKEVSAKAEVTTFSKQQVVLASGQPEVFTPAAFTTPTNTIAGTEWDDTFGVGSVFVDGKRRSARANYSYSADGNPTANELVLDKAKRRAAIRNLDNPAGTSSPGNISSTLKLPVDN